MTIKGIDVSDFQEPTWSTAGLSFVFAKATEGHTLAYHSQTAHAARARAAGMAVGFYHFMWPGDVQAQAEWFVGQCASVEGDLLAVDWESTSAGTHASCADKDALIKAIKALRPDHKVGLYCNRSDWTSLDKTSYFGDFLWIADYNGHPGAPGIQADWAFHQYTSSPIDSNVGAFTSTAALKTWATGTTPPQPPEPPVALTAADGTLVAKAVLNIDDLIPSPTGIAAQHDADTNLFYAPKTVLNLAMQHAIEANVRVQAVAADVEAIKTALGGLTDPGTFVAAVAAALAEIQLGVTVKTS